MNESKTPDASPAVDAPDSDGACADRPSKPPADLRAFLAENAALAVDQLVDLVCEDQVVRWRQGTRVPAETYLAMHSALTGDAAFAVVYAEYALREQCDDAPTLEEYRWRFPQFAARLERQVSLHLALSSAEHAAPAHASADAPSDLEADAADGQRWPRVDKYVILEVIGRGGMGVVYKARQVNLDRLVALKMILAGRHADSQHLSRFLAEAAVVARLQHPHIVHIYEVGESDGCPFLSLEYVAGGSLADLFKSGPMPTRQAAQLVEVLARAMHHAHQQGVVHRDLKPANVLLRAADTDRPSLATQPAGGRSGSNASLLSTIYPKITDFGLAKTLPELGAPLDSSGGRTQTGAILGTPAYMAPEQAAGKVAAIGPAADVYALGAILYEALTGRPPFRGETVIDTLEQVRSLEPVPPSRLEPSVPHDLETICIKCLQKEPGRRYDDAEALADDLDRFLAGEPIHAKSISHWERAARWARRRPTIALLLMLLLCSTIGALASLSWGFVAATARATEVSRRAEAVRLQAIAEVARADSEKQARETEFTLRQQAEQALNEARVALAERVWLANDVAGAQLLLDRCLPQPGQPDLRGWEWHYLNRLCNSELLVLPHRYWVNSVAFDPSGILLASAAGSPGRGTGNPHREGELKLWDAATGQELAMLLGNKPTPSVLGTSFHQDGRWLLAHDAAATWYVFDTASRQLRLAIPLVAAATILPTEHALVTCGQNGQLKQFDLTTGECVRTVAPAQPAPPDKPVLAAFSSDGLRCAVRNGSDTQWIDSVTGKLLGVFRAPPAPFAPVLSPDARWLIDGNRLWNLDDHRDHGSLHSMRSAVFSPDSTWLANLTFEDVQIGQVAHDRIAVRLRGHNGLINDVQFGPHPLSNRLATAGDDQSVRIWQVDTGTEMLVLRGHTLSARCLAFSPDGRRMASGGQDAAVRVWDLTRDTRGVLATNDDHYGEFNGNLAFTRDGRRLLSVRHVEQVQVQVRDCASGRIQTVWPLDLQAGLALNIADTAFTPDGQLLAGTSRSDATVLKVWEMEAGTERAVLRGHTRPIFCVAVSATAERLASMAYSFPPGNAARIDGIVHPDSPAELFVWNALTGELIRSFTAVPSRSIAMSQDGRLIAAAGFDHTLRVWQADNNNEQLAVSLPHQIDHVAFSPDGEFVAATTRFNSSVWSTASGKLMFTLDSPTPLTCAMFSPDGRRLATTGYEGMIRLYSLPTGHQVFTLQGFAPRRPDAYSYLARVAFSADGKQLAASNWNSSINIWDAGEPTASVARALAPAPPVAAHAALMHTLDAIRRRHPALEARLFEFGQDTTAPETRQRLARALTTVQDWDAAYRAFYAALELDPADHELRRFCALTALFHPNHDAYELHRREFLSRFGATTDPIIAERTAVTCLLREADGDPLAAAAALAERAATQPPDWLRPYVRLANGLAEYRRGDYHKACDWLNQAMDHPPDGWSLPMPHLVLALAHQRRGNHDEADSWHTQSLEMLHNAPPDAHILSVWFCHLMLRELEALRSR